MAETKVTGVPRRAKLEIPLVVDTRPDEAAGWDVVEGLLDGLMARANSDDRASLIARAGQAYARAKGNSSKADQTEWELGHDLAATFILVLAHRGMTADQWASLFPKELGTASGFVSGAVETAGGLLGLGVDVNQDGAQTSVGSTVGACPAGRIRSGVGSLMPSSVRATRSTRSGVLWLASSSSITRFTSRRRATRACARPRS